MESCNDGLVTGCKIMPARNPHSPYASCGLAPADEKSAISRVATTQSSRQLFVGRRIVPAQPQDAIQRGWCSTRAEAVVVAAVTKIERCDMLSEAGREPRIPPISPPCKNPGQPRSSSFGGTLPSR
jgi:hypothetical protein